MITDKIEVEIENNNLDLAKSLIQDIEKSLLTEKSDYTRGKLQEKLNKYRHLYSQKISIKDTKYHDAQINIPKLQDEVILKDFAVYENLNNENIKFTGIQNCTKIKNVQTCTFDYLEVKESLILEDSEDCFIKCRVKQLRIKNCKNIKFEIFVEGGISLEKSTGIFISKMESPETSNNYKNVNDFTSPFTTENYTFL
ncbi:tubulin-specific chaperone C [Vairimorpha necatrix]|uniref:Tubulin-specific chaperone C n=1 Tax=Vairimorpha necatrix TaxID=6039 RepID=A0AAX4JE07_9MICR